VQHQDLADGGLRLGWRCCEEQQARQRDASHTAMNAHVATRSG
jgi:hypothetical protein